MYDVDCLLMGINLLLLLQLLLLPLLLLCIINVWHPWPNLTDCSHRQNYFSKDDKTWLRLGRSGTRRFGAKMVGVAIISVNLCNLSFSKYGVSDGFENDIAQLHHSCDASTVGFGACSYLRVIAPDGRIDVSLIARQGRLAPLKAITTMRHELITAVTAVQMGQFDLFISWRWMHAVDFLDLL